MKNIVIIGSSRGIGRELAIQLSKDHHVLALSRNQEQLKTLSTKYTELKTESIDISKDNTKTELTKLVKQHFDHVDVLINNAGILVNSPALELDITAIKSVLNTNIVGLIQSCQAIIPLMENGGHIVNIGSMGGFQGSAKFPGLSIYSASKAAVANFTECLAEELKDSAIKTNCLALGAAQTEMLSEAFPGYEAPVSAQEMANFIADFSLNAHQWMNGKVIPVSLSTP